MNQTISITDRVSGVQGKNLKHIPSVYNLQPKETSFEKRIPEQGAYLLSKKVVPAARKSDAELEAFKSVDLVSLFDISDRPVQSGRSFPVTHLAQKNQYEFPPFPHSEPALPGRKEVAVREPHGNAKITLPITSQQDLYGFQNEIHKILEQIRATQSSLQIIGFVSANSGEGVSTICSSLAAMSAEMQKSLNHDGVKPALEANKKSAGPHAVLLIDAQIHHPSIHSLFGTTQTPGLAELLNGEPLSRSIRKVLPHLHIIACGRFNKTYLTQVEWMKFAAFLKQARLYYSHIIIDLPALARYPAGIDLARLCQAVTLVVEANKTRRQTVQDVRTLLKKNGVPILGGILNKRNFVVPDWLYRYL